MTEQPSCTCGNGDTMRTIYACSGGSNVGQIANQAAIRLSREGVGKFFCLAGIGGEIRTILDQARLCDERIVIDGCPVQCAKKIMDAQDLVADRYVIITDLGIKKITTLT